MWLRVICLVDENVFFYLQIQKALHHIISSLDLVKFARITYLLEALILTRDERVVHCNVLTATLA